MRTRCLGSGTVARFVIAVGLLWPLGAARVSAEMLLFYDFNTVTNDDTVIDTSGKGNHGQQFGTEFTNPGLGHTGAANDRALDFLGAVDAAFLDVPSALEGAFESIADNDAATVAMWMYGADEQPVDGTAIWFAGDTSGREMVVHVPWSDGVIYYDMAGCDSCLFQFEPDPDQYKGRWNHYAFVKEGEYAAAYRNGELLMETEGRGPFGLITTARFGTFANDPPRYPYAGLMDDIGVWDEALSADAIAVLAGGGVDGDFDLSGVLDAADIDALSAEVVAGTNKAAFDLNGDALVNVTDRDVWVRDLKNTYYGDADLNGEFNSGDFVAVFTAGEYEDATASNSGWADGDWNGDADFNSGDFVAAFSAGGYELGPRASVLGDVSQVPEPAVSTLLFAAGLAGLPWYRRRCRR